MFKQNHFPVLFRIQAYTEHALRFIELVPDLINQSCDRKLNIRDQTFLVSWLVCVNMTVHALARTCVHPFVCVVVCFCVKSVIVKCCLAVGD